MLRRGGSAIVPKEVSNSKASRKGVRSLDMSGASGVGA